MFFSGNIRHKSTDLSVVDFAKTSEPLTSDSCRHLAVLLEVARIEDENAVVFADFFGNLFRKTLEQRLVIPVGLTDESLECLSVSFVAIRNGFNVFAWEVGEQSFEENLCILACFGASEMFKGTVQK
jgi:hypothetical protein